VQRVYNSSMGELQLLFQHLSGSTGDVATRGERRTAHGAVLGGLDERVSLPRAGRMGRTATLRFMRDAGLTVLKADALSEHAINMIFRFPARAALKIG
jgi:hypothetical protein